MTDTSDTSILDDKAVQLRTAGRSFGSIARLLGYDRVSEATLAFNRGLRRRPGPERSILRDQELRRLDALAERLRATGSSSDTRELDRKLRTVNRLRAMVLQD